MHDPFKMGKNRDPGFALNESNQAFATPRNDYIDIVGHPQHPAYSLAVACGNQLDCRFWQTCCHQALDHTGVNRCRRMKAFRTAAQDHGVAGLTFFSNYRPQFYFRTTDITGMIELPDGTEMCMPGDNTKMTVELINPIAMDEGLRFAIREGGRTVGAGAVTKILE